MRTQDVINEVRTILQNNLTDPNKDRRIEDKPWIYTHQPNTSSMPTIQIHEVDSNFDKIGMGNFDYEDLSRIQIDVRIRVNNEYDYDADYELETASDGLNYLVNQVRETILSNHDSIKDELGFEFKSILPVSATNIQDLPNSDAIQKSTDFQIRIENQV